MVWLHKSVYLTKTSAGRYRDQEKSRSGNYMPRMSTIFRQTISKGSRRSKAQEPVHLMKDARVLEFHLETLIVQVKYHRGSVSRDSGRS